MNSKGFSFKSIIYLLFVTIFLLTVSFVHGINLKIFNKSSNTYLSDPRAIIFSSGDFNGWIKKNSPLNDDTFIISDLEDSVRSFLKINKLIIIPSYSLAENEDKLSLKHKLETFVKSGGVIIVFAQQYGRHVEKVVPIPKGEKLKVYGWRESKSGYMGVIIDDLKHPIFSFAKKRILRIPHDGYFGIFPSSTKVLLRRLGDRKPVCIYYKYGKGYVFLSSIYPGEAFTLMRLTKDTVLFVKNLLNFSNSPGLKLRTYLFKEKLRIKLKFKKDFVNSSEFHELLIYSPSGKLIKHLEKKEILDKSIRKNGYVYKNVLINPDITGIYSVFKRIRKTNHPVMYEEEDYLNKFAINNIKNENSYLIGLDGIPKDKLRAKISFDKEEYYCGDKAMVSVVFKKKNPDPKSYFVFCNNGKYEVFRRVVVKSKNVLNFPIKVSENPNYFLGIYGRNGKKILYRKSRIRILKENISVFTDKEEYKQGEVLKLKFKSKHKGRFNVWFLNDKKSIKNSEGEIEFKIPEKWNKWLNDLSWNFETDDGKYFSGKVVIKISRLRVISKDFKIDRNIYNPKDSINIHLMLVSNKKAVLIRRTWIIKPSGKYYVKKSLCKYCDYTDEKYLKMKKGVNLIDYSVDLESNEGGEHKIRIAFLDADNNQVVNWTEKTFVVNLPHIVDFSVEKNEYKKINEDVNFTIACFGKGDAKLSLILNHSQKKKRLFEKDISLNGKKTIKVSIKSSKLIPKRNHIKAILSANNKIYSDKSLSVDYDPDICDYEVDYIEKISKGTPFDMNINVHISNNGKSICKDNELILEIRRTNDDNPMNGELIYRSKKKVDVLKPEQGKTFTFPLRLLGLRGEFIIISKIDDNNEITEYNENNNINHTSILLPNIYFTLNKLPKREGLIKINLINNTGKNLKGKLKVFIFDDNDKSKTIFKKKIDLKNRKSFFYELDLRKNNLSPGYYEVRAVLTADENIMESEEFIHIESEKND